MRDHITGFFYFKPWLFPCRLQPIKTMTDTQDINLSNEAPVCKPTKWFLWRVLVMLAMLGVFLVLFLQDGFWGYREKNLQHYLFENFKKAGIEFQKMQQQEGFSEQQWKDFASAQKCGFSADAKNIMPRDADLEMMWPDSLVNGYDTMSVKGGQNGAVKLWEDFAATRKWDATPIERPMDEGKIREQFYSAGVTGVLILVALFILLRTMRRSITADEEALYTQDGKRIVYADMVRIDKRKWETKGLALIYYNEGGAERKVKIDGMVYGQFKEEDGAPAEKLFNYVMDRFKGEVIEYLDDAQENEDGDDGANDSESAAEEKNNQD